MENAQFLLFLVAVIKAVDEYQDLLRMSVASPGNDHRLGANEAPPAIVSMFVGDELGEILDCLEHGKPYSHRDKEILKVGVHTLPRFPKDTTDRNRTSPFAFTGNKFEFRMLGSSDSIADANVVLNTITAEELSQFADTLETAPDFEKALDALVKKTIKEHKRILFNGDGYTDEWVEEAERRGLLNLKTTVDAIPALLDPKNIKLFTKHGIFTEAELHSRYEISMENYSKTLNIEALTMIDMVNKKILPAVERYVDELSVTFLHKKALNPNMNCHVEYDRVTELSQLSADVYDEAYALGDAVRSAAAESDVAAQARAYEQRVLPAMEVLRRDVDHMETLTDEAAWPMPTYADLIYHV